MTALKTYLKRRGLTQREFGALVGVTQSMVSQWLRGEEKISPESAKEIETKTRGDLRRKDLRPDIFG